MQSQTRLGSRLLVSAVLCCGVLVTMQASAQPQDESSVESQRKVSADVASRRVPQPIGKPSLRARIERRLGELQRSTRVLNEALTRLENGEDPGKVAGEVEQLMRGGRNEGTRQESGRTSREQPQGSSLSNQQREEAIAVMKESLPDIAERLEKLKESDPQAAERLISRMMPRVKEALAARARDSQLFELKIQEIRASGDVVNAAQAVRKARAQGNSIVEPLAALRTAVGAQFDARQRSHAREITLLEARVDALKLEAEKKAQTRDEVIENFVNRLSQDEERGTR